MNTPAVFIKWFPYDKRNETIAAAIGAGCHFIYCLQSRRPWNAPFRYVVQFVKTLALLFRERPRVVFVTNPPIFAAATVALYCTATGGASVIDSHSGVSADKWRLFEPLHRFLARRALRVIVTNQVLEKIYRDWGAETGIVTDVVMEIPRRRELHFDGFSVVVICSFDSDEPIADILGAAAQLPDVTFYLTGNFRRAERRLVDGKSANVIFTGYLADQDYFDLLHGCDAVMVLVNTDNTMQQGAYEAVSVRKPMILSDWEVLRSVYDRGTVFVRNDGDAIAAGVQRLREGYAAYRAEMDELYEERKKVWERVCCDLLDLVASENMETG
jgi:glycosyltransferase involved in cell wall biosynthesis